MKCSKCQYTTFDHYKFCPKCNTQFEPLRLQLHIIDYTLTDDNNYLFYLNQKDNSIDTEKKEDIIAANENIKNNKTSQQQSDDSLENILDSGKYDDKTEKQSMEDNSMINPEVESFEKTDDDTIELDQIDLGDLLDTNKKE